MAQDPDDVEGVDFALVVYREENVWRVEEIGADRLHDVDDLSAELRRWPGDFGSLGLISIDEDFFVLGRVAGSDARWLLSDVTAATEWPLARSVVEALEIPMPDDEDDQLPAGDLAIVADLGLAGDGHGRDARRLRPLPRRDPRQHRGQAGLRLALRGRGRRPRPLSRP